MKETWTDMNRIESREFVVKHRSICCGQQFDTIDHDVTNSWQFFVCRRCDKSSKVQYWPLSYEKMRDIKLNSILC
jgi:hypothetical protein